MSHDTIDDIRERLQSRGGHWIGRGRSWMQSHIRGGSLLEWSSMATVNVAFRDLQDLCLEAAVGAVLDTNAEVHAYEAAAHGRLLAEMRLESALKELAEAKAEIARLKA